MNYRSTKLNAELIKNTITPYDFYLSEQGLSRFGTRSKEWAIAGLCPFHKDRNPGSFFINLVTGGFNCFSCGEKGGDIITFVMKKYNLSFREALEFLYNRGGIL